MNKTIPLGAVRVALDAAIVRRACDGREVAVRPVARFAAYTAHWLFVPTCADAPRRRCNALGAPSHCAPMSRGGIDHLVTRMGAAEAKRTFGKGVRALRAEIGDGVMR